MKNFRKILIFFLLVFLVSACSTIRKGFTPDKKSGEEFLVEKKSPLVMPPNFSDLPIPSNEGINTKSQKSDIKSILLGSKNKDSSGEKNETVSSVEKLILEKIKKN